LKTTKKEIDQTLRIDRCQYRTLKITEGV